MSAPSAREIKEAFPDLSVTQTQELARAIKSRTVSVDSALELANTMLGGFGIEPVREEGVTVSSYYQDIVALYVNMGDTYDATILYDTVNQEFQITSWGDWYAWWEEEGRVLWMGPDPAEAEEGRHTWRP